MFRTYTQLFPKKMFYTSVRGVGIVSTGILLPIGVVFNSFGKSTN